MNLSGANVLLTGGSRGLGPVIAESLAARGARVALAARTADALDAVCSGFTSRGATAVGIVADVANAEDRRRLIDEAERALGSIDVLVNNAGIESVFPFPEVPDVDIEEVITVNVLATMLLTRAVLPRMLERGRGHVVNIASLAGKSITPWAVVYGTSKHAVVGFSHSLRAELHGTGVGVSVVCPGYVVETGMFADRAVYKPPKGSGTVTTPAKVARAVVRAIENDVPEIVVAGLIGRLADISLALSPRLNWSIARRSPAVAIQREEAEAQRARRAEGGTED